MVPGGVGRQLAVGAAIIGFVIAGLLVITLIQFVGWLAIGLIGLMVLLALVWLDMLGGHALADFSPGGESVNLLAKQMAQMGMASAEEKLAVAGNRESRRRLLYIAWTIGIALTATGFGMFFLHQV